MALTESVPDGPRQVIVAAAGQRPQRSDLSIRVAGRNLRPTEAFETYWRFAAKRQAAFIRRLQGHSVWTADPILSKYRFTNVYRASDRVSQFLIREVIYRGSQDPEDVVFRTLLFKFFNSIPTWRHLSARIDLDTWTGFDSDACAALLDERRASGQTIYSAAYVIPPPRLGHGSKHRNHLSLLQLMMESSLLDHLASAQRLGAVYEALRSFPSIGDFLAFQFATDLNYSDLLNFDEDDFVVAGPGARDGVRKCFGKESAGIEDEIIRWMTVSQNEQFSRFGLSFHGLPSRPLKLIDVQNVFCEVDKYCRVALPHLKGDSGRKRIKQSFKPSSESLPAPWFPPRWKVDVDLLRQGTT